MSLRKLVLVCTGALPLLLSQACAQVATLAAVLGTTASLTSLGIQSGGLLEGSRSASKCFSGGNLKGGLKDCSDVVTSNEDLAGLLEDSDRLVTAATVDSSKNRLRQKLRSTCDYAQSQRDLGNPIILGGAENEIFGDKGFQSTCCHGKVGEVLQRLQVYIDDIERNYSVDFGLIAINASDLAIFFEALRVTFLEREDTFEWAPEVRSAACLRDMAKLRDETEDGCGDYVLEYIDQWKGVLGNNIPLKCPGVPLDA